MALCLLSSHEEEIMECDSFESIVDYLKTTIPSMTEAQMEQTIAKVGGCEFSIYYDKHKKYQNTCALTVHKIVTQFRITFVGG